MHVAGGFCTIPLKSSSCEPCQGYFQESASDVQMLFYFIVFQDCSALNCIFCLTWLDLTPMRSVRVKNIPSLLEGGICECVPLLLACTHARATHNALRRNSSNKPPSPLIILLNIYSQIIFYEALQIWRREDEGVRETESVLMQRDWREVFAWAT